MVTVTKEDVIETLERFLSEVNHLLEEESSIIQTLCGFWNVLKPVMKSKMVYPTFFERLAGAQPHLMKWESLKITHLRVHGFLSNGKRFCIEAENWRDIEWKHLRFAFEEALIYRHLLVESYNPDIVGTITRPE